VIDRFAVPKLFEDRIGKPEHQNVLDRFLAQVMVNAKNLRLADVIRQFSIQLPR